MTAMIRISIVIPLLHEAERINSLIDHIQSQEFDEKYEIIVVDGNPEDLIHEAFSSFETHGAVIGLSVDGGYYLK